MDSKITKPIIFLMIRTIFWNASLIRLLQDCHIGKSLFNYLNIEVQPDKIFTWLTLNSYAHCYLLKANVWYSIVAMRNVAVYFLLLDWSQQPHLTHFMLFIFCCLTGVNSLTWLTSCCLFSVAWLESTASLDSLHKFVILFQIISCNICITVY